MQRAGFCYGDRLLSTEIDMNLSLNSPKTAARSNIARERRFEQPLVKVSRVLWPWSEAKLLRYVILLAFLDYLSTYAFLRVRSSDQVVEGGPVAGWALRTGGFGRLFIVDAVIILALILLAIAVRLIYARSGFRGLGRAGFVFMLIPYFAVTLAVVYNNVLLAFF
jgi:hypothetical protein